MRVVQLRFRVGSLSMQSENLVLQLAQVLLLRRCLELHQVNAITQRAIPVLVTLILGFEAQNLALQIKNLDVVVDGGGSLGVGWRL
jgi:hypothetical protein